MKYFICLVPIVANLMAGCITRLDAGYPRGQQITTKSAKFILSLEMGCCPIQPNVYWIFWQRVAWAAFKPEEQFSRMIDQYSATALQPVSDWLLPEDQCCCRKNLGGKSRMRIINAGKHEVPISTLNIGCLEIDGRPKAIIRVNGIMPNTPMKINRIKNDRSKHFIDHAVLSALARLRVRVGGSNTTIIFISPVS